jgi:hypothetical protein
VLQGAAVDPTNQVRRFAAELGWRGIERTDIRLTRDICGSLPEGTVVTCWCTNDLWFFIQINQKVPGQFGVYNVSVVAERYNIGPMGFEMCQFATDDEAAKEARRLAPLFARTNFRDTKWRRRYLEQHPEKLLGRKKKWRGWKGRLRTELSDAADRDMRRRNQS